MTMTNRRRFLQSSAAVGAVLALPSYSKAVGANDDLRVAVVGIGGRGRGLLGQVEKSDGVRVVALCDPDSKALAQSAKDREGVFTTDDVRKVLDRKDVDAVVTATPNYWHALVTIWSCQAGKDVYVEKPVSHSIFESVKITEAARKYDRVVQGGFQNRAEKGLKSFYKLLHSGEWGKVKQVRGLCYRKRGSIGKSESPLKIPEHVNYDLWLGPAEDQPIHRPRLQYDWHWDFNTGNGDFGNQGPHELDLMRWALGDPETLPESVQCYGGRFLWQDGGNTANVQVAKFNYGETPCFFEVNNVVHDVNYQGVGVGVIVTCENGEFRGGRGGGRVFDPDGNEIRRFQGGGNHMKNFFDAVRSRDTSQLNAEIASAALSSSLAHMANACYLAGEQVAPEKVNGACEGDEVYAETCKRYSKWLGDKGVDLAETQWTLGPKLTFDSDAMQFTGDASEAANQTVAVRRNYTRDEFVINDEV